MGTGSCAWSSVSVFKLEPVTLVEVLCLRVAVSCAGRLSFSMSLLRTLESNLFVSEVAAWFASLIAVCCAMNSRNSTSVSDVGCKVFQLICCGWVFKTLFSYWRSLICCPIFSSSSFRALIWSSVSAECTGVGGVRDRALLMSATLAESCWNSSTVQGAGGVRVSERGRECTSAAVMTAFTSLTDLVIFPHVRQAIINGEFELGVRWRVPLTGIWSSCTADSTQFWHTAPASILANRSCHSFASATEGWLGRATQRRRCTTSVRGHFRSCVR